MNLAEAIIKGSKLAPKGKMDFFSTKGSRGKKIYACALGAAALGVKPSILKNANELTDKQVRTILKKHFPEIFYDYDDNVLGNDLYNNITYLNDTGNLSRLQIAQRLMNGKLK